MKTLLAPLLGLAGWALAAHAMAESKTVTVAHQDMVDPYRLAQATGAIEKASGYDIQWKMFGGGGDVIKAMASGAIPVGEVGSSPATAAAAQGLDIRIVWVLDDIANAEQLVVSEKSGIRSLADLKGKKIATPFVSTSHYQLMYALKKAGVAASDVQILNLRPPEIAAAWARGDIDGAFVWDPVLTKMKESGGRAILSSAEVGKMGAPTFDAIAVNGAWADAHKDFVMAFVRTLAASDAAYKADPKAYLAGDAAGKIARIVGAKPQDVAPAMAEYGFPSAAEQASDKWLGGGKEGGVAKAMASTAEFLKAQGRITDIPADFGKFVDPQYAAAAAK